MSTSGEAEGGVKLFDKILIANRGANGWEYHRDVGPERIADCLVCKIFLCALSCFALC